MRKISLVVLMLLSAVLAAGKEPIRISAWYWLNSAPRSEWAQDFQNMGKLGFTDVVLCWGLDLAAWRLRTADTRYALDTAQKAGLGAYLVVWHPTHNSLPRRPEFQQVDAAGQLRFTFDTFNVKWRHTQWKDYLQTVARLYHKHPAFAGYIFDDTFSIGGIGTISGPPGKPQDRYISYSAYDKKLYGKEPPRSPSDPGWAEWTAARGQWWQDWAKDTVSFIRAIDSDRKHDVYVEDYIGNVLSQHIRDQAGLDFTKAAAPWDAVGAYTEPHWDASPDSGKKAAEATTEALQKTRAAIGPDKKIIYTFWSGNAAELRKQGPATYPTAEQIQEICEAALAEGIRHLDMYGYRIGDFIVTPETWPKKRPPAHGPYPITGQFPGKYLYDRPQVLSQLGPYLRSLHNR